MFSYIYSVHASFDLVSLVGLVCAIALIRMLSGIWSDKFIGTKEITILLGTNLEKLVVFATLAFFVLQPETRLFTVSAILVAVGVSSTFKFSRTA